MPPAVVRAVLKEEPTAQLWVVGVHPWVPATGTPDSELLLFAERERLLLVTYDQDTMPGHVADHLRGGRHTWGVMIFPRGNFLSPGTIGQELLTLLLASDADEWIDKIDYLP